ncbi:MAG: phage antirepressor KilAC domain-containing protein [Propionicimonas sp.]
MNAAITAYTNAEFSLDVIPVGDSFHVLAPALARSLGFRDAPSMLRTVPESEKGYEMARTLGGEQRVSYITETGFYRVLGQRQAARITDLGIRQQVERFQTWVYSDVLPAIRKTGGYGLARQLPQNFAEALRELASEVEAHELAKVRIRELEPAASAWHAIADAKGDFSVADAAKMLSRDPGISTGEQRLHRWMAAHGWTFRRPDGRPRAYQSKVDAGLLVEKIGSPYLNHKLGEYVAPAPTIRVTPKGMDRLYRDLGGMDPMIEAAS